MDRELNPEETPARPHAGCEGLANPIVNVLEDQYDVYVGSPHDGRDPSEIPPGGFGFLGNPHASEDGGVDEAINAYSDYFLERLQTDRNFQLAVLSVRGKRLGCLCTDGERCHAEVISRWLDRQAASFEILTGVKAE